MKLEIIIPAVIVLISALAYFFVIHSCNKQDNKSYNYFEFTCEDVGSASTTTTSAPSSNTRPRVTSAPAPVVTNPPAPVVTNPPSTSTTTAPAAFSTSPPVAVGGSGGAVSGHPVTGPGSGTGTGGGVGMGGVTEPGCDIINQAACDTDSPWPAIGSGTAIDDPSLGSYQTYVSNACNAPAVNSTACSVCNTCKGPNFDRTACEAELQTRCTGSPTLYP